MKWRNLTNLLCFVTLCGLSLAAVARGAEAELVVRVPGITPAGGRVIVSLYGDEQRFLDPSGSAEAQILAVPADGEVVARFALSGPARRAVAVVHDADCDGALDRSSPYGFPLEGLGLSGKEVDRGRLPTFAEAAVSVPVGSTNLTVPVHYLPTPPAARCNAAPLAPGALTVTIALSPPSDPRGPVYVQLVGQGEPFPPRLQGEGPARALVLAAGSPITRVSFTRLPAGRYAALAFEDLDGDRKVDPGEPFVVSGSRGPGQLPTFANASEQISADTTLNLSLGAR